MALIGDFIGFSFNDVHSSELGLVRTSESNRYNDKLLPTNTDITVEAGGRDGIYYFGSSYREKEINLPVAFDHLTEEQFRRMVKLFSDKHPRWLRLDENPYKQYLVKIKSQPTFKYLCFDEPTHYVGLEPDEWERIYKGEGTLTFVCRTPYARSTSLFIDSEDLNWILAKDNETGYPLIIHNHFLNGTNSILDGVDIEGNDEIGYTLTRTEAITPVYEGIFGEGFLDGENAREFYAHSGAPYVKRGTKLKLEDYYNEKEWCKASGLRKKFDNNLEYDKFDTDKKLCYTYNAGDIEADLKIKIELPETDGIYHLDSFEIKAYINNSFFGEIRIKNLKTTKDEWIVIDSALKVVRGMNEDNGIEIYNEFITYGDFFKLPVTNSDEKIKLEFSTKESIKISIEHNHWYY